MSGYGVSRLAGPDRPSPFNIVRNLPWAWENVIPALPGGALWRDFALANFEASSLSLLGIAALSGGLLALGAADNGPHRHRNVLVVSACTYCAAALPILLPGQLWISPRYLYLPHIAVAVFVGALADLVVKASRRTYQLGTSMVVSGLVIASFVGLVGGAIEREARAYATTSEFEKTLALQVSLAVPDRLPKLLLLNVPWSVAPDVPQVGEHVVHSFAPDWAAIDAFYLLAGWRPASIAVDHGGDRACAGENGLMLDGHPIDGGVGVFDFVTRKRLQPGETGTAIPCNR
jgi:hypothetical protein